MFVCLTIGIVLGVSIMEYYFANQNTFEDFYKRLEIRAIVASKTRFGEGGIAKKTYAEIRRLNLEKLPNEREYFFSANSLTTDAGKRGLNLPASFYNTALANGKARHRDHNIFYYAYLHNEGPKSYITIVSAKNEFIDAYLSNLRKVILVSIISAAVVSTLIGLWFSNLILKPLRSITAKMRDISATQLHLRLDPGKGRDEIFELSETFNNMLDRLEATFETQKNFISNASHELNTPLTTIIGESEYTLSRPRAEKEYTASLSVILSEAERLKRITNSLLHLAQTGYNGKTQEFERLRLDEVIYTVKETVDNIIPGNKVYINLGLMPEDQGKLVINGNLQLMELALVNIVTNGCKYSTNKPVRITLAAAHQKIIIIIEDQGIGIPKDEIAYIYEPFFRASNTGRFNGYGIGLPLARNIIRLHSGELEVTSEENIGTKIKITLPLCII